MSETKDLLGIEHKHLEIVNRYILDILPTNTGVEILGFLSDALVNKLNIDYLEIYSYNPDSQSLIIADAFANKTSILQDLFILTEVALGEGVIGKVAASMQMELVNDLQHHPELKKYYPEYTSAIIVPSLTDGKLVGVTLCASVNENAFSEQLQNTLFTMASITAVKIAKIEVVDKLQKSVKKLEYSGKIQDTLFEIAELIFETSDMRDFYRRLHVCIGKLMFAANFFVGLVIEDGKAITLPYAVDEVDDVPPDEVIPIKKNKPSITGYVLNTNKPLLASKQQIQEMIDSNKVYIKGSLPHAWLGVPFGEPPLYGVVVVQSYNKEITFTQNDEQLLCFVARHIRNAIERMQAKADLQFLALHDPLTKLPNRSLFNDRVNHALTKCKREKDKKIALLFLDLDKFKQVNDTYGHHIGDLLLTSVADVLQKNIRKVDTLSRLGGDEFAILLEDIDSTESAKLVANKIIRALQTPFMLDEIQINTSTSIGIAFHDQHENTLESLVICADKAMYQAKQKGRNQAILHKGVDQESMVPTHTIEKDAITGITERQFFFVFQPVIDLKTGTIIGAEALVRWKYSKMGILPPNSFLNEMEENGSIVQLDIYNIERAFEHLHAWKEILPKTFRLSINISGLGFTSIALLEVIQSQFEKTPKLFQHLSLETTEKSIIKSVELTRAQMTIFSKMGIHLTLDDYGTGYSSLSYMGQFKFNSIKIDRSFVSGHVISEQQSIILESINNLAQSLSIKTIAEGIETQEQLELMGKLKCSMGQGFFLGKPMAEDDLLAAIKDSVQ